VKEAPHTQKILLIDEKITFFYTIIKVSFEITVYLQIDIFKMRKQKRKRKRTTTKIVKKKQTSQNVDVKYTVTKNWSDRF